MEQAILEALALAGEADRDKRDQGEQQLRQFSDQAPEFVGALSNVVASDQTPPHFRQLAAVVLKQNITRHWDSNDSKFAPPLTTDGVKAVVRSNLLTTLTDESRALRSMAALCVSMIAKFDWPDQWPDLFDQLNTLLDRGDPTSVHGAMCVLTDFVIHLDDRQLPIVVPMLLPKLHAIIVNAERWDLRTRSRAVRVMTALISDAFELASNNDAALFKAEVAPILPQWCEVLASLLQSRGDGVDLGFHTQVLEAATVMIRHFGASKKLSKSVFALLEPVWQLLSEQLPVYIRTTANEDDLPDEVVDEDGNVLGFDSFAFNAFGFIEEATMHKKLKALLKGSLPDLMSMLIAFMAISEAQATSWMEDADQFLLDEADESLSSSVRVSATMLIEHLFTVYSPTTATPSLLSAASENIEQGLARRSPEHPHWWKQCEAAMLALSLRDTHETVLDAIRSGKVEFNLTDFMNQVLSETAQCTDCPFLVGRSLILAGRFAEACSEEAVTGMLAIAINSLTADSPIPVQVGGVKALNDFSRVLSEKNPQAVHPYAEQLISSLLPMAANASQEVVREVVETLSQTVKIDPNVSTAYAQQLVTAANAVFLKAQGDVAVADAVGELLSILTEIPDVCTVIIQRAVPTFVGLVQHHQEKEYTGVAEIGLHILTNVVKHCPQDQVQDLLQKTFPQTVQTLLHSDDIELLQTGGEFLRMFVSLHYPVVSAFEVDGSSGLYLVVQFIAYMLSEEMSESACAFIGNLVTTVILKAGNDLGSYVNDILLAVLNKMQQAKAGTVILSLLFIFARLANENTAVVLDFLVEQNALEFVMNLWCTHFDSFYGDYDVKVSTSALIKILLSGHPALDTINVQGDIIEEKGIRTRSKSRADGGTKYTTIPLKTKLFKLLVGEYQEQLLKAQRQEEGDGDDDDDYDDDGVEGADDDDDDEEGWEDVDEGSVPKFMSADEFYSSSDMLDLGLGALLGELEDEETANDPDAVADPIYHINLRDHLLEVLRSVASDESAQQAFLPALNAKEQDILQRALSTPVSSASQ